MKAIPAPLTTPRAIRLCAPATAITVQRIEAVMDPIVSPGSEPRMRYAAAEAREACGNGHRWRKQTTRWRKRTRDGKASWERFCLVCKREREHDRRARRRAQRRAS